MSPGSTSQQAGSTDRPADAGAVRALLKAGKLIEAEAAVGAALAAAPGRPALLRVAAAVAEHRGDLEATLARWEAVRAAEPGEPTGFIGALRSLRRLGRIDLAEPILREGRARLWDNVEFVVMAAQVATTTKKVEEAEQAWRRATELAPDNPEYALSAAMALIGPRKGRRKRLRVVAQRLEQHHQQFASHVPGVHGACRRAAPDAGAARCRPAFRRMVRALSQRRETGAGPRRRARGSRPAR